MAILSKSGSFQRPSAGSTNSVVTGVGFQPNAVIFLDGHYATAGSWQAGAQAGMFVTAPLIRGGVLRAAGIYVAADNADAIPNALVEVRYSLWTMRGPTGSTLHQVGGVSHDADGFTLDWSDTPYDGIQGRVAHLALGGDLKAARIDTSNTAHKVGNNIPIGTRYTIDYPNTGFVPQGGIFFHETAGGGDAPAAGVCFVDSYLNHTDLAQWYDAGSDPSDGGRAMATDGMRFLSSNGGALLNVFRVVALTPASVTVESVATAAANPTATLKFDAVLFGGEGVGMQTGVFARSTDPAPATQVIPTRVRPKAAIFGTIADAGALPQSQPHNRLSLGFSDGATHGAIAAQIEDNVGTSNSDSIISTSQALIVANNATPTTEAALAGVAFNAADMTLTWNPNNAAPIGLPSTYGPVATAVMRRTPALRRRPIDAAVLVGLGAMRRLVAFHEAGHAVVAFVLGWDQNLLKLSLRTNADESEFFLGARRITDLARIPERTATSLSGAPPMPDDPDARRAWARIGGAIAWGGAVAEDTVRAACGFPLLKQPAVEYSAGDWDNWTRYRDASPEPIADYALATRKMAKAAIAGHHRQLEDLANALLERGDLSIAECLTIWHRGALPARGVVGRLRLMPTRAAAPDHGCPIPVAVQLLASV